MPPTALPTAIVGLTLAFLAVACGAPTGQPEPATAPLDDLSELGNPVQAYFEGHIPDRDGEMVPITLRYQLDFPPGYSSTPGQQHALLVFLHGGGGWGCLSHSEPLTTVYADDPPILLCPELPDRTLSWKDIGAAIDELIGFVVTNYPIDESHVYLIGYSAGGYGALAIGSGYPQRFAAVVSVAGYYDNAWSELCALKDVPVRLFHGKPDQVVPFETSQAIADQLTACGGRVTFSQYDDLDHFAIGRWVFGDPDLYRWLREQGP